MTSGRNECELAAVSTAQDGLFTHQQATELQFSQRQIDSRVKNGIWLRVFPSVYRHAGTPPSDRLIDRAALLWAGDAVVLSHRTAAAMWGFDGIDRPDVPELTVLGKRHPRSELVTVHRTLTLPAADVRTRAGIPITSALRTIVDLASVVDDETLENALESARRKHLVTTSQLRRRLDRIGGRGRKGAAQLNALVAQLSAGPPTESVLEVRVARLLRASGLPASVRQHRVRIFGRVYRLDFAWPKWRVALECDGRAFHEFQRDRTRLRRLGASGWRILPVTWNDVTHGWSAVEAELRSALDCAA